MSKKSNKATSIILSMDQEKFFKDNPKYCKAYFIRLAIDREIENEANRVRLPIDKEIISEANS